MRFAILYLHEHTVCIWIKLEIIHIKTYILPSGYLYSFKKTVCFGTIHSDSVEIRHKRGINTLFLRCIDWFPVIWTLCFCIVGPDFLVSLVRGWPGGLLCACFLADGLEGGVPEQAQMVEASRVGPVRSERLNLQTSQPVAAAPQNKWDFNSIRVRLLWPPHGRNY